jgi:hypothetical protein
MKKEWKVKIVPSEKFEPSEERRSLYDKYWAEAQSRQRSSSENFDKSILTYSSSGLAISLAFLKDFVPIGRIAVWPHLLYLSWVCFVLATGLTISSFLVSYRAQELSAEYAEEYLINGKDQFYNKKTWRDAYIKWSNVISGVAFVIALILTSVFVKFNLERRAEMSEQKSIAQDGMLPAKMQRANPGDTFHKGMPPASMPLAPVAQKPVNPPATQPVSNDSTSRLKNR